MQSDIELLSATGGLLFLISLALLFISFTYLFVTAMEKSIYTLIFIAALIVFCTLVS
jgi:hypothetical protein